MIPTRIPRLFLAIVLQLRCLGKMIYRYPCLEHDNLKADAFLLRLIQPVVYNCTIMVMQLRLSEPDKVVEDNIFYFFL